METKRALVADDEKCVRDVIRIMLEKCEYKVDCAENSDEATNLIEANQYDLIISDNDMPEADAGIKLLKFVRSSGYNGLFILQTGGGGGKQEAEALGAFYLPKPFGFQELRKALA